MRDICRSDRSARETLSSSLSIDCPCQKVLCFASGLPMPSRDCLLFRNQMPITMGHLVAVRLVVSSPSPRSFYLLGFGSANLPKTLPILTANKYCTTRAWAAVAVAVLVPGTCLSDLFSLCQFLKLLHPKPKQPNPFWFSFVVVLTAPA